jgi:hypothetical protein
VSSRRWWEADPERLERELKSLKEQGLIDVQGRVDGDSYMITFDMFAAGERHSMEIRLPAWYPHVQPSIHRIGADDRLERHEGPFGGLCVFEDPEGSRWWPDWLAAETLVSRARELLIDSAEGAHVVAQREQDGPEPATSEYLYDGEVLLMPDQAWDLGLPAERGSVGLLPAGRRCHVVDFVTARGAHKIVQSGRREVAALAQGEAAPIKVPWMALDHAPRGHLLATHLSDHIDDERAEILRKRAATADLPLLLLTYAEEGPGKGQTRRAWIGVALGLAKSDGDLITEVHVVQQLTAEGRQVRIPSLRTLSDARVVVIGAGSLGAPVALELAKSGVGRLSVVDDDVYDVGNAVRHVLPLSMAGSKKSAATAHLATLLNPFIDVVAHEGRLGNSADTDVVDDVLAAGLVIDTTGSADAARVATALRLNDGGLLVAGLTRGAIGGEILVHRRGGPCYTCFKLHQRDGTMPRPPASKVTSSIWPVGCRAPTFHGTGMDATFHAARVAQVAVRLLGSGPHGEWPHNWASYDFTAEKSQHGTAAVHPSCYQLHP